MYVVMYVVRYVVMYVVTAAMMVSVRRACRSAGQTLLWSGVVVVVGGGRWWGGGGAPVSVGRARVLLRSRFLRPPSALRPVNHIIIGQRPCDDHTQWCMF